MSGGVVKMFHMWPTETFIALLCSVWAAEAMLVNMEQCISIKVRQVREINCSKHGTCCIKCIVTEYFSEATCYGTRIFGRVGFQWETCTYLQFGWLALQKKPSHLLASKAASKHPLSCVEVALQNTLARQIAIWSVLQLQNKGKILGRTWRQQLHSLAATEKKLPQLYWLTSYSMFVCMAVNSHGAICQIWLFLVLPAFVGTVLFSSWHFCERCWNLVELW